jgi:dihydroneopterin aldolase
MERIELEGMKFYAFHGHYPVEKEVGNEFLVDLIINTDGEKAGKTDNLLYALNYQTAYEIVKAEMEKKSDLLENVATRILDQLFNQFPEIHNAEVKVSKMNPPMGGEIKKVSVVFHRQGNN